jgi:hypothetical protein
VGAACSGRRFGNLIFNEKAASTAVKQAVLVTTC